MSLSSITDEDDTFVKTSFTSEEETFLDAYIPVWRAKYYAASSTARKGEKKKWVAMEPYPKFIAEFYKKENLQPQEKQLQEKMYRWFLNRARDGEKTAPNRRTKPASELKKPRATHAFQLFTEEKKEDILKLYQEKTKTTSPIDNLSPFKECSKELWDGLTQEAKDEFSRKACEKNELIKKGPSEQDIERNQANIIRNTVAALSNLTGYHWSGHGDVAFFVMGAYRKKDGEVTTFYGSVSDDPDFASKGFHRRIPDFKANIGDRFKAWAEGIIPGGEKDPSSTQSSTAQMETRIPDSPTIGFIEGYAVLPALDLDKITPHAAKTLLERYITAAWKCGAGNKPDSPVPWQCLGSINRRRILKDPGPFAQFETLDPTSASIGDVYSILKTILAEQNQGGRALQFELNDVVQSTDVRQVDKIDFSPPRPKASSSPSVSGLPSSRLIPKFTGISLGESANVSREQTAQLETDDGKGDAGITETPSQLRRSQSEAEDEGLAGRHSSPESENNGDNGLPSSQKRKKQVKDDHEGKNVQPDNKRRKVPPASKAKAAKKSGAVRKNRSVKVDVESNVTSRGEKNPALPMLKQSAHIHDKKYKNKNVTIRRRDA